MKSFKNLIGAATVEFILLVIRNYASLLHKENLGKVEVDRQYIL